MNDLASSINVMVDIETFGRRPRGLVVSIGAVAFRTSAVEAPFRPDGEFHATISWDAAATETRFERHPKTMEFWAEQTEAYERLQSRMKGSTLNMSDLMQQFCSWLDPFCTKKATVWGNSPSFDLVIIENAANEVGVRYPVIHSAENDYRTLTDLVYGPVNKPRPPPNIAHDALADARFQAEVCNAALLQVARWRAQASAAHA